MADWEPGFDMTDVSVSVADVDAGSPKLGDRIARNPANHADRWLVGADYFAANFAELRVSDSTSAKAQGHADPFVYRAPTAEQVAAIQCVRETLRNAHGIILRHVPASRERSVAITKLEEVSMWANKGIVFG